MKFLIDFKHVVFIQILIISVTISNAVVHHSLEEARLERQRLVQKYIKTLNKEEGAIRLVGGDAEYEGNYFQLAKLYGKCEEF